MDAVYVSNNSFTVVSNRINEFIFGRRVKLNCGVDGLKYSTISSSNYSDPNTTVVINENEITSNLISVAYGVVQPGISGSLPDHDHSNAEGTGGVIDMGFVDLNDTPITFSGEQGKYLIVNSTGSGIDFKDPITLYGTDDPPAASNYDEGTIYFKYTN